MGKIFFGFLILYLFLSSIFYTIYIAVIDSGTATKLLEYSLYTSFGFNFDSGVKDNDVFTYISYVHQIIALFISTIFTAAIVLKFFYLPNFFIFKKRCNYLEKENKLIISLYNSINLFVTKCNVKVYGRVEFLDENGTKSLLNINNSQPVFEKTYPFMEQYLVTRLIINIEEESQLNELLHKKENKKLELIILIEANASNVDSTIYETHKYTINLNNLAKSMDLCYPNSIDLNVEDYSKSKGWEKFDN
ncbi:hypothetical protein [Sulfurimonas sp.]